MNTTQLVCSRRGRLHMTAVSMLAVAVLVLGGCGDEPSGAAEVVDTFEDISSESAPEPPNESTSQAGDADDSGTAGEASGDAGNSANLDLPRSATYGGWEWTIEDATFQPAGTDDSGFETPSQVTLDITVVNTLQDTSGVPVGYDNLSLLDGDGVAMSQIESFAAPADQLQLDMPPGGRSQGTLTFDVDDGFSVGDASFQIAQPSKVPAVLPFGGEQPEQPYPIEVDISAKGKKASGSGSQMATFKPLTATIDLDAGAQRAEEGTHWILVTVRVTGHTLNGTNISPNTVLLLVDGSPTAAAAGDAAIEVVHEGESMDVEYLFALPDDATELGLQVGTPDDKPDTGLKTFPLDLPDLPDVTPAMS